MAGYSSRQSSYTTGDTITAAHSNDEFDAIVTAFGTSGHNHDGTAGNGGALSKLTGSNSITIGAATAGTDITVTFDGETNDGVFLWMEDEDYFKYNDDIMIIDNETLIFGSDSDWTIKYDESGDDDLVLTGSDISVESATSAKPVMTLFNSNADANGATLKFKKDGTSAATSDVVGNIDFLSEDAGAVATTYGRIQSTIVDVTAGGEQGGIDFYVAENDGTLTKGMSIQGASSDGDITVDISTHDGTAGGLKLGGTLVTATASELNALDGFTGTVSSVSLSGSTNNTIATVTGANALAGEAHLTFDGSDLKVLEDVNDGNPSISIGGADAEKGMIQAVFDSGAQTLDYLEISTATADSGGDAASIRFDVDGTDIFEIDDGGITFTNGANWEVGVAATSGTTAGKGLTVAAGSSATGSANINGGNLTLSSGGGDGTGTSLIDFKTKVAATDVPASKMQLSGAGVLTLSAGGVVVPDDGDIGSASATDAIQISSGGIVTFKDDIKIKDGGTIGTASDADAITIDASGNVSASQNLTVTGNLTVNGTTTTLDTATLAVVDPIIHLQTASDGGALGSDTNKDVGIAMQYHTGSAAKTAFLGIDDDDSYKLKFIPDASLSSEVVSGSVGTISANFEGGTVSGTTMTVATSIVPDTVGGADIGSTSAEWGDVFVADDKYVKFGNDQDVSIGYDETTTDALVVSQNVNDAALGIILQADAGADAGDEWKLNVANGGVLTLGNDIASAGTHATLLTATPNATAASSTLAFVGDVTSKGNSVKTIGKETIWVPATAMTPAATNPCADITTVDSGTNSGPDLRVLDFDKDSDEHAQFSICMPKQWDGGNITFKAYWIGIAATTGCSWALQVKALNDNEDINVAYGTAVVVDDSSQGSATELLISPESGDIACSGAADDLLFCQIFRDVSDANDDMSGDARLVGVRILFTTDKANDS
tara:strand:- start:17762 stop:20599 length:2838 start_codon:yes stop_codon:yes gene_type:complete